MVPVEFGKQNWTNLIQLGFSNYLIGQPQFFILKIEKMNYLEISKNQ